MVAIRNKVSPLAIRCFLLLILFFILSAAEFFSCGSLLLTEFLSEISALVFLLVSFVLGLSFLSDLNKSSSSPGTHTGPKGLILDIF